MHSVAPVMVTAETHQQTTNMQRRCMRLVTRGSVSDNATVSLPAATT